MRLYTPKVSDSMIAMMLTLKLVELGELSLAQYKTLLGFSKRI